MISSETVGCCCGNNAVNEERKMLQFDIQQQLIELQNIL